MVTQRHAMSDVEFVWCNSYTDIVARALAISVRASCVTLQHHKMAESTWSTCTTDSIVESTWFTSADVGILLLHGNVEHSKPTTILHT